MYSLQSRLGFWLAFLLILIFSLHIALMSYFPRYLAEKHVLTRLQHDAESFIARLHLHPTKGLHIKGPIAPIYRTPFSGHYFQAEKDEYRLLSPSLDNTPLTFPQNTKHTNKTTVLHLIDTKGWPLLAWQRVIFINGQAINLIFAEEIKDLEADIATLRKTYFFGITLTILLMIGLQRFIIRREMRPVEQARQELLAIEHGQKKRITQTLPSEIQPLVDELNHLLEVMTKRLERSRHATGNLAHALKTPLSILIQLADSEKIQADPALSNELAEISATIQTAINRELKRARLAGAALAGQHFTLNEEIPALIQVMRKVYATKNIDIQLHLLANKIFQADREDMLELFGNLLDNACKWAKYCVTVTIQEQDGLSFSIEDDGSGITPAAISNLTQRGTRLDEATPGHGLGLAIVQEIVEQYKGKMTFETSQTLGGLKVVVHFYGLTVLNI